MLSLSLELLRLFANGQIPATTAQRLAAAAWADGWGRDDELAARIKGAGAGGTRPSNVQRDLFRAAKDLGIVENAPEPYLFLVPGKDGAPRVAQCILIHEMHQVLCARSSAADYCLAPETLDEDAPLPRLVKEWAASDDVRMAEGLENVAPLGLHGDGVQYTSTMRAGGAKSIYALSYNYLAGNDVQRAKRLLVSTLRKADCCDCGCAGWHTFQALYEVIAWSMQHLRSGVAPAARHDGSPWSDKDRKDRLPEGTRLEQAALLQIRGDWEWLVQSLRFRHYSSQHLCFLCDATKEGLLAYTNFDEFAAYRTTLHTHRSYLLSCAAARCTPAALFKSPGLRLYHVAIDAMHSGDLGVFQDVVGSLFWLEITHKAWHRTQGAGIEFLNTQLRRFRQAHGKSELQVTLSQIRAKDPGYPTLKAKAAQTRHCVAFALVLANLHARGNDRRAPFAFRASSRLAPHSAEHRRLVVLCVSGAHEFLVSCDATPFVADDAKRAMLKCLSALKELHDLWRRDAAPAAVKSLPWHLRPKAHALHHLVLDQLRRFGSPRQFWCYGDEGFMGAVKSIAASSRHPRTLELTVLRKSQLAASLASYAEMHVE